jgi:phosphopantothenoylcysteine decarboxylase/phosphopantothenate--cysteine ligase
MRILITSGGTKVPIDSVRSITNMSKGTFGAKIATEALTDGHEVFFLRAEGSCSPFSVNLDFCNCVKRYKKNLYEENILKAMEVRLFADTYHDHYREFQYKTFEQYDNLLGELLITYSPDVVVLAAAVSDYGVANPVDGKIRSTGDMDIHLTPLPKIISKVKKIKPDCFLVGFKLLVNSKGNELGKDAMKSIKENDCDIVVGNDLEDIRHSNHKITLFHKSDKHCTVQYETDFKDQNYLAKMIMKHISCLTKERK